MRLIGLTGGTGSGKSAAGARFAQHGIPVIDADAVGHALLAPGGALEGEVLRAFGPDIATSGGIDRKKLGQRVFADPEARRQLNGLIHPAIHEEVARRVVDFASEGHEVVIVDAALLAESGEKDPYLSGLILVLAAAETRLRRLVESRGLDAASAQMQIDAQTPPWRKRGAADWIIENDGTFEELYAQVDQVAQELTGMMNE
jgi:dephospho-CoA kinase